MLRYLIFIGDPRNPIDMDRIRTVHDRHRVPGSGWCAMVDAPGFYAGYFDTDPGSNPTLRLHDDHGVVFGNLYANQKSDEPASKVRLRSIHTSQSKQIVASMGRILISRYWGYYVAAIRQRDRTAVTVMRSPVSPLACLHWCRGTLHIFFSHFPDLVALQFTLLSINWDSIAAQVVGRNFLTHETAINQIDSLECGEAVECSSRGSTKRVYWDPRIFLGNKSPNSFSDAGKVLRRAVDHSVGSLSSGHDRILVNLSGGLDSSIVLNSLVRAPHSPEVTAVNYYSRGCGDERRFARDIARTSGVRLLEHARNDKLGLTRFNDCKPSVRPILNFSAPDVEARNSALAEELGASAIFDGELGDNLFGRVPGPGVLVECLRENGLGSRFLSLAVDYSALTKQSIWRTLASTHREVGSIANNHDLDVSGQMHESHGVESPQSMTLASNAAAEHYQSMSARFLHPWFRGSRAVAPGSDRLLFGLVAITSPLFHAPFGTATDPQRVSPFISQPLAEVAMRIPGYFSCRLGQDRAVARAAFGDVLPSTILYRGTGKGGPDLWAKDVMENNIEFLRSFLLDGILVKRRLIDRTKLETVLSPRIVRSSAIVGDIFAKLYIEAWIKNFPSFARMAYSE